MKPGIRKLLKTASGWVFGAYLVSWIFDQTAYPQLISAVPEMPMRLKYYFLIVPWVYACSLVLSGVLDWISRPIREIFRSTSDFLKVR